MTHERVPACGVAGPPPPICRPPPPQHTHTHCIHWHQIYVFMHCGGAAQRNMAGGGWGRGEGEGGCLVCRQRRMGWWGLEGWYIGDRGDWRAGGRGDIWGAMMLIHTLNGEWLLISCPEISPKIKALRWVLSKFVSIQNYNCFDLLKYDYTTTIVTTIMKRHRDWYIDYNRLSPTYECFLPNCCLFKYLGEYFPLWNYFFKQQQINAFLFKKKKSQ